MLFGVLYFNLLKFLIRKIDIIVYLFYALVFFITTICLEYRFLFVNYPAKDGWEHVKAYLILSETFIQAMGFVLCCFMDIIPSCILKVRIKRIIYIFLAIMLSYFAFVLTFNDDSCTDDGDSIIDPGFWKDSTLSFCGVRSNAIWVITILFCAVTWKSIQFPDSFAVFKSRVVYKL